MNPPQVPIWHSANLSMKHWDVTGIIFNVKTILDDKHVQHYGVEMLDSGDNIWDFVKVPTNNK